MTALGTVIARGLHSARPAAGSPGRVYFETDTSTLFRDNGSSWDSIEGAGGLSDGGTVSTFLDFTVGSAPATPASGAMRLYAKTGKHLAQKDDAGLETLLDAAGGGATTYPPPASSTWDDDFPGSSLDAKWTNPLTSNTGNDLALTVSGGQVVFEPNTAGSSSTGLRTFGIRQNAPTGNFKLFASVADGGGADDARVGIFVAKTGGKAYVLGSQRANSRLYNYDGVTTYSETADWSGYDGTDLYAGPSSSGAFVVYGFTFVSGVLWAWYGDPSGSATGIASIATGVTQPDRCGLVIWANTANVLANHQLTCDWFRVVEL